MVRQSVRRGWMVSAIALVLLVSATSAYGQAQGSLRGLVTDEAGKGVPEAEIVMNYVGDVEITVSLKTNIRGEFTRAGLRTGEWKMTATKGELTGVQTVHVKINEMIRVATLIIKVPTKGAGTDTTGMTDKDIEARNKLMATMQAEFDAGVAAIATAPDDAIAKLLVVAGQIPNCAICHAKIGDAHTKKGDQVAAEASYKEAIKLDPKLADPYAALAILYNQQKKFDESSCGTRASSRRPKSSSKKSSSSIRRWPKPTSVSAWRTSIWASCPTRQRPLRNT